MKTNMRTNAALYLAVLGIFSLSPIALAAGNCPNPQVFGSTSFTGTPAQWRAASSNLSPSGSMAKTDSKRERNIRSSKSSMEGAVLSTSTPLMEYFVEAGVKSNLLLESGGYHSGEITKIQVSKIGSSGVLKLTLALPVSGHTGVENAKNWAKTDTYSIVAVKPDPKNSYNNTPLGTLVSNAKSLDIVTIQEVEVPLIKGETVRILYERSGSGSGGFIEGRALDIFWSGN